MALPNAFRWFGPLFLICAIATAEEEADETPSLGPVEALAQFDFSHDGKFVLIASSRKANPQPAKGEKPEEEKAAAADPVFLTLWDVKSRKRVAKLEAHKDEVRSTAFSSDGRWIASGGADGQVTLWFAQTRKPAATFTGHPKEVLAVQFNPASNQLASGDAEGNIFIWEVYDKMKLYSLPPFGKKPGAVRAIAYCPNSNVLVYTGDNPLIRLWDATARTEIAQLEGHETSVSALEFSPNGKFLVSSGTDGAVCQWDVQGRKLLRTLETGAGETARAAFSPDGRYIVTSGAEETLMLWDLSTGQILNTEIEAGGAVQALRYSPDKRFLGVGISDRTFLLEPPVPASEEEKSGGQRNRMLVWGEYSPRKVKGNFYIFLYKSIRDPYSWHMSWQGRESASAPLRIVVTGDVAAQAAEGMERPKDAPKGNEQAREGQNAAKEKEKPELTINSGKKGFEVVSKILGEPTEMTFTSQKRRFRLYFETSEGKGLNRMVPRSGIYIGCKGAHPSSMPFNLYQEKEPPSDKVLARVEKIQKEFEKEKPKEKDKGKEKQKEK